jgi:hypothetical protein
MAIMIMKGVAAQVEFTVDPVFRSTIITCVAHRDADSSHLPGGWEQKCSTLDEAIEYAAKHADGDPS